MSGTTPPHNAPTSELDLDSSRKESPGCIKPCGTPCGGKTQLGVDLVTELKTGELSSGDLARQCGTTLRTVRFYEEEGLLECAKRSDGGHRSYRSSDVEKLRLIGDLREAGLSIAAIRELFQLKRACATANEAASRMATMLTEQVGELEKKIDTLRRLQVELAETQEQIAKSCGTCDEPDFKTSCGTCEVTEGTIPRALALLWRDS